jgi:hypothetical protein
MPKKRKGCLFYAIIFAITWIPGWMIIFRVSEIADRSSDNSYTDFSDTYRFENVSKRKGHRPHLLTPFFDAMDIANDSDVIITKGPGDTLLVTQQLEQGGTADCKVSLADSQFYWRKGELRYFRRRVPQGGILPALGWQSYSGTITKSENGDIHFATLCYEKGLIFCVIPFWETFGREKFVLKMKPFQD